VFRFQVRRPADRRRPCLRRDLGVEHLEARRLLAAGPPTPAGAALLLLHPESMATSSVLREETSAGQGLAEARNPSLTARFARQTKHRKGRGRKLTHLDAKAELLKEK
jgi:hypothetical protein